MINEPPSAFTDDLPASPPEGSRLESEVVHLYETSFASLFHYALTIVPDSGIAEEAIQECFLRYFLVRREGHRVQHPKSWLFRVMRNHLLDIRRRDVRRNWVSVEELAERPDREQDLESYLRSAELMRRVEARLTVRELECLALRIEGMNYLEIAALLRVRPGTVGALVGRALGKVRGLLRPEQEQVC